MKPQNGAKGGGGANDRGTLARTAFAPKSGGEKNLEEMCRSPRKRGGRGRSKENRIKGGLRDNDQGARQGKLMGRARARASANVRYG